MSSETIYTAWLDENGFHFVAQKVASDNPSTLWSIHSQEWESWSDGKEIIGRAMAADMTGRTGSGLGGDLGEDLTTAGDKLVDWEVDNDILESWWRDSENGNRREISVRPQSDSLASVLSRAPISDVHTVPESENEGRSTTFVAGGANGRVNFLSTTFAEAEPGQSTKAHPVAFDVDVERMVIDVRLGVYRPVPLGAASSRARGEQLPISAGTRRVGAPTSQMTDPPQTSTNPPAIGWRELVMGGNSLLLSDFPRELSDQHAILIGMKRHLGDLHRPTRKAAGHDCFILTIGSIGGPYCLAYQRDGEHGYVALGVWKTDDHVIDESVFLEECAKVWKSWRNGFELYTVPRFNVEALIHTVESGQSVKGRTPAARQAPVIQAARQLSAQAPGANVVAG
jgi:hypothetical protein